MAFDFVRSLLENDIDHRKGPFSDYFLILDRLLICHWTMQILNTQRVAK